MWPWGNPKIFLLQIKAYFILQHLDKASDYILNKQLVICPDCGTMIMAIIVVISCVTTVFVFVCVQCAYVMDCHFATALHANSHLAINANHFSLEKSLFLIKSAYKERQARERKRKKTLTRLDLTKTPFCSVSTFLHVWVDLIWFFAFDKALSTYQTLNTIL